QISSLDLGRTMKEAMDSRVMKELVKKYIDLLKGVSIFEVSDDSLASGIVFFYSCILYISNFEGWHKKIKDVASLVMLYVMVDHYLDDYVDSIDNKTRLVSQMGLLISSPDSDDCNHSPFLKEIAR